MLMTGDGECEFYIFCKLCYVGISAWRKNVAVHLGLDGLSPVGNGTTSSQRSVGFSCESKEKEAGVLRGRVSWSAASIATVTLYKFGGKLKGTLQFSASLSSSSSFVQTKRAFRCLVLLFLLFASRRPYCFT